MANANELLGLLHGLYGVGAVLSPLAATSLITKANVSWYYFYYIMVGLGPKPFVQRELILICIGGLRGD